VEIEAIPLVEGIRLDIEDEEEIPGAPPGRRGRDSG
jgi:hypothetical protein